MGRACPFFMYIHSKAEIGKRELDATDIPPPRIGPRFVIVAIGSSAGGLHALSEVLSRLPREFPSSVVVVQHMHRERKSTLASLLRRVTPLTVKEAEHGDALAPGTVYIAPPDQHLLVGPGKLQLAHTQLIRFLRPSIDLMFESAAGTYGSRCIGVVLSGSLRDGAEGLRTIKEAGGTTIVENPVEAEFKSMPQAALDTGCVDLIFPLPEIGPSLVALCAEEARK